MSIPNFIKIRQAIFELEYATGRQTDTTSPKYVNFVYIVQITHKNRNSQRYITLTQQVNWSVVKAKRAMAEKRNFSLF
jgi:hypothetical protein